MKFSRATIYTPAVTMVAAWIKARPAWTSHGVGQPHGKGKLGALAHGAHEQQDAHHGEQPETKSFWCKSRLATPVACMTT